MAAFGFLADMPMEIFSSRVAAFQRYGMHVNYPYGLRLQQPLSEKVRAPFYKGLGVRVFFYAPEADVTKVKFVYNSPTGTNWYVTQIVDGTKVQYAGAQGSGPQGPFDIKDAHFQPPGFYSSAVAMDGRLLRAKFNNFSGDDVDQNSIVATDAWYIYVEAPKSYIMSIHWSAESGNQELPNNKLNISLMVGSFCVYAVEFTSGNKFMVVFKDPNNRDQTHEYTVSLQNQEIVTVFVRNTSTGYLMQTSFDTQPAFITGGYRELIAPVFRHGHILRAHYECGPAPKAS
ncbi:uncharacterized protein LOC144110406 [Amblyomma americanum]